MAVIGSQDGLSVPAATLRSRGGRYGFPLAQRLAGDAAVTSARGG